MATATATKVSLKPLDDRVLVEPTAPEERTASGIFLPEAAQEKPLTGTVVAVGPGKLTDDGERNALTIKKGDKVLFGKYSGTEIELNGVDYKVIRESELLGVIE